jgi:cytochrome c oxidase cbb3-type subunit 1
MSPSESPGVPVYDDVPVRGFALATIVWGVVGMLVGVVIAAQLAWPELNFGVPWLSFGRLRPLHTNAVIFAFGGCALMATSFHVVQRTCQTPLFAPFLARFVFWGWQAVIVAAAISLPLGYTQGKEYAELEWPIDILITLVWVSYAIVFFGTVGRRKVRHIYVANWFFGAFILAVALLHVVNSAAIPAGFMKSYSAYAGVQDAMVQWWYGHNAVGFFLTAGFLGMMYYYIPKQAERPVYSYRLSIVHFWALIFTYMWAGPHHLHYTALPDWAQSIGMLFSLILLAPSWGGMINGVMTLSGAWHKLRDDPILKFLIVALSFYGMSTFEGPMMAIKTVNALGRLHLDGIDVLPDPAHVRPDPDAQRACHRAALLDRHHRRRALHRRDVDRRGDARADVACGQPRRHAGLQLRRKRQGHLPVLRGAAGRRGAVPGGHVDHGLERGDDRVAWQGHGGAGSHRAGRGLSKGLS